MTQSPGLNWGGRACRQPSSGTMEPAVYFASLAMDRPASLPSSLRLQSFDGTLLAPLVTPPGPLKPTRE